MSKNRIKDLLGLEDEPKEVKLYQPTSINIQCDCGNRQSISLGNFGLVVKGCNFFGFVCKECGAEIAIIKGV